VEISEIADILDLYLFMFTLTITRCSAL